MGACLGKTNSGGGGGSSGGSSVGAGAGKEPEDTYKVIVVGDGGVGKSAVTIQFIQGRFEEEYDPTIEDTYQKFIEVDKRKVCLNVVDTAGQEDYTAMRDTWLRMGDAFILVFSLTDNNSLQEVKTLHDAIVEAKDSDNVPIVLVGNKKDLVDKRQVPAETAQEIARSWTSPFIETSAKTAENVERVFFEIVRECRRRKIVPRSGN